MIQNIYGRRKGKTENISNASYSKRMAEPEVRELPKDHSSTDAIFDK